MKVDLHLHASERSSCSKATEQEQIRAAIAAGLDAVAFTDHERLVPREHLRELNRRYAPFRIFTGIEIKVDGEDVLVLGVHDPALENTLWRYPELHTFVRARQGFLAIAHPFRYHPEISLDLERFAPDALEIHSINIVETSGDRIRAVAARLGLPLLCNSDAHSADVVGRYYNVLERAPADEHELMRMLREGRFVRHRLSPAGIPRG
jgi:histidinol phosphatase-like PHP family hydrolase